MRKSVVFPGQGSQCVGMGKDLKDKWILDKANEILGFDLKKLCFDGPEEELAKTENAQPAIFTVSCAKFLEQNKTPDCVAGHSVGEYAALFAAGSIDFETGLGLVRVRGRLMSQCDPENKGAMAALVGKLDIKYIQEFCQKEGIDMAGLNSPEQVVVSGDKNDIKKIESRFSGKGLKVIFLRVGGAFHSRFMKKAKLGFAPALLKADIQRPNIAVVFNATGDFAQTPSNIKFLLWEQITSPVLWQRSIENMVFRGVNDFEEIEIGPKKRLTPLIDQILGEI